MPRYLVTYDVSDESEYESLYANLEELKAVRALESVFLLDFEGTGAQLFDRIARHLKREDLLLVTEISVRNFKWKVLKSAAGLQGR